jgi:SSS family solute:Na+ symporter
VPDRLQSLTVVIAFLVLVLIVGQLSKRRLKRSQADYFIASRSFGTPLLFLAILGTNLSAFAMLGAPGAAYHVGVGMYWVAGGALAVTFPLLFLYLGRPIWRAGQRNGYLTPVQLLIDRFDSTAVGMVAFAIMALYTIPYILTGQIGSGLALQAATGGAVPYWVGSLLVTVIVGVYVSQGGMRGTAWTNAVQVLTFLLFLAIAMVLIPRALGGYEALGSKLLEQEPGLLTRGDNPSMRILPALLQVFTFTAAFMAFPQVSLRMLAARNAGVIRKMATLYPFGFLLAYIPVVALALWGAVAIPGLAQGESDSIILSLTAQMTGPLMAGFGLAALYAMIMSTMDAQVLSVSSLFTVDVVERFWPSSEGDGERGVRLGRIFVAGILAVGFGLSLLQIPSVFFIANLAFTGFGVLFPVLIGTFYVRRLNKQGALAGLAVGSVLAPLAFFGLINLGSLPSLPVVLIEVLVMAAVSAVTPATNRSGGVLPAGDRHPSAQAQPAAATAADA